MKASILAVAAFAASVIATPVHKDKNPKSPFVFTSTYSIVATPDQVVNPQNQFTGGLAGAIGYYNFGINSYENTICYNITLVGFQGVCILQWPSPRPLHTR